MIVPKIPLAQTIIQLCKAKGIKHIVISPGSRNAPLTIGFTNDSYFRTFSIVDERCAAFFALGIAQKIHHPVAIVCTSGSALLNYFPAVAEAYYSNIPLVVLSADRPEHLIGIGDGQTIDQKGVYGKHVLSSINLNPEKHDTNVKGINEALNVAIHSNGPVHINCPFAEPLYETMKDYIADVQVIPHNEDIEGVSTSDKQYIEKTWNTSKRIMVLVGVNSPNSLQQETLNELASDERVVVLTETTSNLYHQDFVPSIDKVIMPLEDDGLEELQPELLVTFGGMIVSKKVKAFLRKFQPKHHWHIDKMKANDTFFCLTKHIKQSPQNFFSWLLPDTDKTKSEYRKQWNEIKLHRNTKHKEYLQHISFSDFQVFNSVLKTLPDHTDLHLGNSSTVRYAQLFDLKSSLKVYCNRGTSGIDGSTSTAIGSAVVSKSQSVFITGDLSFFYDSNALWNNYMPNDFRIILINNSGGGIFRILPGNKNSESFDTYFETIHDLDASQLCKMYGLDYLKASDNEALDSHLQGFYASSQRPRLLEIFTPRKKNDQILLDYFKFIK